MSIGLFVISRFGQWVIKCLHFSIAGCNGSQLYQMKNQHSNASMIPNNKSQTFEGTRPLLGIVPKVNCTTSCWFWNDIAENREANTALFAVNAKDPLDFRLLRGFEHVMLCGNTARSPILYEIDQSELNASANQWMHKRLLDFMTFIL